MMVAIYDGTKIVYFLKDSIRKPMLYIIMLIWIFWLLPFKRKKIWPQYQKNVMKLILYLPLSHGRGRRLLVLFGEAQEL